MTELELERRAKELAGETIVEVRYQQLRWRDDAPLPGTSHAVEVAVYLRMASGLLYRIGWADELGLHHGHHVTLSQVRRVDDANPTRTVTWPARTIKAAALVWRDVDSALRSTFSVMVAIHGDHLRRSDFPQALQLELDDGTQIFIAAAHQEGDRARGFANHLLVVFSRAELERLGLA